jgi:hypothetical protein
VFRLDGRECTPTSSIAAFLKANDTELVDRSSNDFGAFFGRPRLATDPADFETGRQHYSGSAEWSGHNLMHSFVGGDMGRLDKSPNDPLFWLHHANVDRLWTHWSASHSIGDYAPDWSQESLSGYVNPDGSRSPAALAGTVISPAALGYSYAQPAPVSATRGLATGTGAAPVRIVNYVFEMRRIDPGKGVIDIPPDAGAAFAADAVGYLKIDPDPQHGSVMRLRATDQSDGSVIFDDKVFQVAMGMKMGLQGYRIDLSRVWRGTTGAGLRLEAETGPLVGRQAGPQPPALVSFVVDAKAMFLA